MIVFVMGPTCSGKSTFLRAASDFFEPGQLGLVEVGKMMRAKYPPEHFQGQAAPKHTAGEAWQMCVDAITAHQVEGKRLILVDGQPRDRDQTINACAMYPKAKFLWLSAPLELRQTRALLTRDPDEYEALTKPRLTNDMIGHYDVMWWLGISNRLGSVVQFDCSNLENEKPGVLFEDLLTALWEGTRTGR